MDFRGLGQSRRRENTDLCEGPFLHFLAILVNPLRHRHWNSNRGSYRRDWYKCKHLHQLFHLLVDPDVRHNNRLPLVSSNALPFQRIDQEDGAWRKGVSEAWSSQGTLHIKDNYLAERRGRNAWGCCGSRLLKSSRCAESLTWNLKLLRGTKEKEDRQD